MSKNTKIADLINYISVDESGNVVLSTGGQVATQSYVTTAVSNLVNSAPSTLDTLNELAAALGNDANFATTVTNSIATKLPLSGGTLTGALNGTTATFSSDVFALMGVFTRNSADTFIGSSNNTSGITVNGTTLVTKIISGGNTVATFANGGATTFSNSISASIVRSINGGVDGTFQDAFVGVYSSNNNEQNAIQTSVSSVASSSGFLFQASNGGGSTGRTDILKLTRAEANFYTPVVFSNSISAASATFNGNVFFSDSGTSKRGIQGTCGVNDFWFVGGGATAENTGYLEIATGDDGQISGSYEPIYVSQYGPGAPLSGTLVRRATLLDNYGNTFFPNTLGVGYRIYAYSNIRSVDNGYGAIDFHNNGFGYQYAAKFFTFRSPDLNEAYGFTNDYGSGTSAELAMVSKGSTANIGFYTGTSTVAKVKINPAGRVSIGVAAEAALHVAIEGMDDQLVLGSTATNRDIAMHMYSGTTKAEVLRFQSGFRLLIGNGSAITKQSFITGGAERVTIENGGLKLLPGSILVLAGSGADFNNSTGARLSESYGALWNFSNSATWHHQIINGSSLVGFQSGGGNYGSGNIYATGSITASYSDVRLKRNFIKISDALSKVCNLNGYTYQHNELGQELLKENPNKVYAGFKAQEVQSVLPEAVTIAPFDLGGYDEMGNPISKSGESYLTINYDRLGVLFAEAIKELKAENDELRAILNRNNII